MAWIAAVDYQKGSLHAGALLPCQDYGHVRRVGSNAIIGVIADGAGYANLSHIGAREAVKAAFNSLQRHADNTASAFKDGALKDAALLNAARDALSAVRNRASDMRKPITDFAATLIAFVAKPYHISAVQIGDGFLITSSAAKPYHRLCEPQRGEFVNETVFLTDSDALDQASVSILEEPISFIAAGTDGLETVSIRQIDGRPHAPFFRPFDRYLSEAAGDEDVHLGIRRFLRSERLTDRVEDDVTLLLCGWRNQGGNA